MENDPFNPAAVVERDRGAVPFPLPTGIATDRAVRVRMRDGIHLSATVFQPDRLGRYPVVMCVTVYGKDRGPQDYSTLPKIKAAGNAVGTIHISEATTWEGPDPAFWVPNGYVVVVANARGYYESEGDPGIYSEKDAEDYADLIEWAGTQPWSNGSVGLNGVSYLAINQWMTASQTRPSHLKAIIPWEGASDLLRDVMDHGGIPETRFLGGYYAGSLAQGAGNVVVEQGEAMMRRAAAHPFPLENIDVPALICGSWSDQGLHTRGSFEGFARIASRHKWLYTHGGYKWEEYYSPEALEWQKSFLDHFLKGEDNGFEKRPAVRLEVRRDAETFDVRSEPAWPLPGTRFTPLHLNLDDGRLTQDAPAYPQAQDHSLDGEQISFDLTFSEETEVTGPMVLKLWVSPLDANDLDLFVAVRKIDALGREVWMNAKDGYRRGEVSLGWLRLSRRHLDPERSTPLRPFQTLNRVEKVEPGDVVEAVLELLPSSVLYAPGETMRLIVSGRDILEFGRFGHDDSVNSGRFRLFCDQDRPSTLTVPLQ